MVKTEPEIFIITVGQTWRISQKIGCTKFPKIIEKQLSDNLVRGKWIHHSGPVFSTEEKARTGHVLKQSKSDILFKRLKKRTRLLKKNQKNFRKGSKVDYDDTSVSLSLNWNLEDLQQSLKFFSDLYKTQSADERADQDYLIEVQDQEKLNENYLIPLLEKKHNGVHCTHMFLQHEDNRWDKGTLFTLLTPNKRKRKTWEVQPTLDDILNELDKQKVPKDLWLEGVKIKIDSSRNTQFPLKTFIECHFNVRGTPYKYLFGDWFKLEYQYVYDKEREYLEWRKHNELKMSHDFPILPWTHEKKERKNSHVLDSDEEQSRSLQEHKSNENIVPKNQGRIFSIDSICLDDTEADEKEYVLTESFSGWHGGKTFHYFIKLDFSDFLNSDSSKNSEGYASDDEDITNTQIKAKYKVRKLKRVSSMCYFIPNLNQALKSDLEKLLFLRLNTQMPEGEYNDCYIIYRKLLELYHDKRFLIIPGDELFVKSKNIELYDILLSDEKEKITYVIHVKAGFGQTTRDVCSQIRLSADIIYGSLQSSSCSAIKQYYQNNVQWTSAKGYKGDVARILHEVGENKYLDLFTNDEQRLIFVYAYRHNRKYDLHETSTDISISAEIAIKNVLCEKGYLSEGTMKQVIERLKEKNIIDSQGEITNNYSFKNKKQIEENIKQSVLDVDDKNRKKTQETIMQALEDRSSVSNSWIAKWEIGNLKNVFERFIVGTKEFGFKICQIPSTLCLKAENESESIDDITDIIVISDSENESEIFDDVTTDDENVINSEKVEVRRTQLNSRTEAQPKKGGLITDYFNIAKK